MLRIHLLCLTAAFLTASSAVVHAQNYGATGVLKIKPGEAPPAMGQAGVALYQGPSSLWWNPALLSQTRGIEGGISFAQRVPDFAARLAPDLADDMWYYNFGVAAGLGDRISLGAYLLRLDYGETEAVDQEGRVGKSSDSREYVPCIGAALSIPMRINAFSLTPSLGLGIKYVNVDLAPEWAMQLVGVGKQVEASTFGVDIGMLTRLGLDREDISLGLSLGANVQNLGGGSHVH